MPSFFDNLHKQFRFKQNEITKFEFAHIRNIQSINWFLSHNQKKKIIEFKLKFTCI